MRTCLTAVGFALAITQSSATFAQDSAASTPEQDEARFDSGSGSGLSLPKPQIMVKSDVEGEAIKLTFSTGSDSWNGLSSSGFAVSLNAPFNKDKNVGHLITDAGLPGTASVDFTFHHSFFPSIDKVPVDRPSEAELRIARTDVITACQNSSPKPDECPGTDIRTLAETFGSAEARAVVKRYYSSVDYVMVRTDYAALTLIGSIGRETLNYRDATSFAEAKEKNTPFSFGTSFGYIPHINRPWGFFFGGEYKRYYELPDEETRCPVASGGAVSVTCFTSAFAPPEKKTDATIFGAVRFTGPIVKLPFSAELKVAYEPKDDRWGVALPVYFIKDKDGKFNGGFKTSWESDTDDFSFGFFIGGTFDFLKL